MSHVKSDFNAKLLKPWAVILSHRHGAAVAVIKSHHVFNTFEKQNLDHFFSFIQRQTTFEFTLSNTSNDACQGIQIDNHVIFTRVLGKTAENLCDLYLFALKALGLENSDINTIAVGAGPGSFTGLRLGCAFANGLCLGKKISLLPIPTHLISDMMSVISPFAPKYEPSFLAQLGTYSFDDDSTGYLTFFDLIKSVFDILHLSDLHFVDSLVPNYARDPGPLLKLKGMHV